MSGDPDDLAELTEILAGNTSVTPTLAELAALDRYETCLYVIGFRGGYPSAVKIGWSTNVLKRLRSLQAANPHKMEVVAVMRTSENRADPRRLSDYLKDSMMEYGNWYARTERVQLLISVMQAHSAPPETADQ